MVTKGLDFDNVHVVGILNADQMLSQPDFRAHERSFQMMSQVAGRAGRRGKQGLVILQTRQPDVPVIEQVVRGDYEGMYRTQLAERRAFRFPPEVRLINIFLRHRKEAVCESAAPHYARLLLTAFSADDLMGRSVARASDVYPQNHAQASRRPQPRTCAQLPPFRPRAAPLLYRLQGRRFLFRRGPVVTPAPRSLFPLIPAPHTNETFITKTNYHKNAERNSTRITNNTIKGYRNTPFYALYCYCLTITL